MKWRFIPILFSTPLIYFSWKIHCNYSLVPNYQIIRDELKDKGSSIAFVFINSHCYWKKNFVWSCIRMLHIFFINISRVKQKTFYLLFFYMDSNKWELRLKFSFSWQILGISESWKYWKISNVIKCFMFAFRL